MRRWLFFAYGVSAYAGFMLLYPYMAGFVGNFLVPKSIDTPAEGSIATSIVVDVLLPGHAPRKATALFERTRKLLIEREGARCFVSRMTAEELGAPLEAHHHPIERCFAEIINWSAFSEDCKAGHWGP